MRQNSTRFFNLSIDTNRKTSYTPPTGSKVQPDKRKNQQGAKTMTTAFRVITTTGSFLTDGQPETQRIISRHRTREAAERALAAYRRISPLEGLRAIVVSE
jgi:hypothetical protein